MPMMTLRTVLCLIPLSCWTLPSFAAVGAPFSTCYASVNDGATTKDYTCTIDSGHTNTVAVFWVNTATEAVIIAAVAWDIAGVKQAASAANAAVTTGTTSTIYGIQPWCLINPTPGTSKTVRVTLNVATSNVNMGMLVFDGADQTSPCYNFTSSTAASPAGITITANSGDATASSIVTSETITSTDKTSLWDDDAPSAAASGGDWATASGNVTHNWVSTGVVRLIAGMAIKQFRGGGGPTCKGTSC